MIRKCSTCSFEIRRHGFVFDNKLTCGLCTYPRKIRRRRKK